MSPTDSFLRHGAMHRYLQHEPTAQQAFYQGMILQLAEKAQKADLFLSGYGFANHRILCVQD